MKLNFWQWVGVAFLILAAVVWFTWDKPQRDKKKTGASIAPIALPLSPLLA